MVPQHLRPGRAGVFARACEMGLEGIVSKRVGSAYWSGDCRNWTKAKNPSFTRLALHEKRGVNSSPAESISSRTGQNHSEKGSSSPWPRTPIPHRLMCWVGQPRCLRRQVPTGLDDCLAYRRGTPFVLCVSTHTKGIVGEGLRRMPSIPWRPLCGRLSALQRHCSLSRFRLANQRIGFLRFAACADSQGVWHGGKVSGYGER